MIVVTGAAGFIGSVLVGRLNADGQEDLILVDDFSDEEKNKNLAGKKYGKRVDREEFISWFYEHASEVEVVFHIGARTDTTEFDKSIFDKLNLNYSKSIWEVCTEHQIPLIYASSAATYGLGEFGYDDDHAIVNKLKPLNPYGESKNDFDKWVLEQSEFPEHWYGLKFFNVYGPNEYHKARMASVIFHAFNQIKNTGVVRLFKSHRPDYKDGKQLRDFIYVKDVIKVCFWLMENQPDSGIYNLGTGQARSFEDLANATYAGMDLAPQIQFIDMPEDIREKYQYFTEANMQKLKAAGYTEEFYSLEKGVNDYVRNYLSRQSYY